MKTCVDCKRELSLSSFHKKPSNKDGHDIRCKECRDIRYNKADPRKVFAKIYRSQIDHSISRGHPSPTYTLDEFVSWIDEQPQTWDIWQAYLGSHYSNALRPSVDRLDDSKSYSLDNIQLMVWEESRRKGARNKKAGSINAGQRPVAAYHKDGTLHKEYISIMDAAHDVGGRSWGIVSVANGVPVKDGRGHPYTPKSYKGFKWEWIYGASENLRFPT